MMDEEENGTPLRRRSARKRRHPLHRSSPTKHDYRRYSPTQVSKENKISQPIDSIKKTVIGSFVDSTSFNESDLLLADIVSEDLLLYDDRKESDLKETLSCDINSPHKTESLKCDMVLPINTNTYSPDQDLFDDGDLFDCDESPVDRQYSKKESLEDSFSELFFRPSQNSKIHSEKEKEINRQGDVDKRSPRSSHSVKKVSESESSLQTAIKASTPKRASSVNLKASSAPRSASLKDKLKQRLQMNVGASPPQVRVEDEIRKEAIAQAKLDASQIRKEGIDVDIGPFHGLPAKVQHLLESTRNITKLYDWQVECLELPALRERRNLIYSLPTSGGKTLVAEILIMRELLCYKRDAMIVLPFVSIVQEKVRTIAEFGTQLGFLVEEYAGSKGRFPPLKRREKKSLYIATIEKAHSLINSLIETDRIHALGLIVVDELHMIGEGCSRGANLETMLLKVVVSKSETQIVGMSATLNNIKDLQDFLHAEIYSNDFRPVSLKEYVKVDDNIFSISHKALDADEKLQHEKIVTFPYSSELLKQDPDHLLGLVLEVIPNNSCLIFCPTKKNCENVVLMLSKLISRHHSHLRDVKREERQRLLQELRADGSGRMCPVLAYSTLLGLAYHHSGLTADERTLIESGYANGTLCMLAATSTLAAGVNLPAKRVILRSPFIGMELLKLSQYKQMVGRAGRAGIDSSGESILIVKSQERMKVKDMLAGPKDLCHSSLAYDEGKGVRSLLLSAIGLKIVTTTETAFELMNKSLLHIQSSALGVDVANLTKEAIQYLIDKGLVIQTHSQKDTSTTCHLEVTPIGKATFKGSVDHAFSSQLYKDLKSSEVSLNLATYLHLLFLVTPYDTAINGAPAWDVYFKKFCQLSEVEAKVASLIGVPESYLALRAGGQSSRKKVCHLTIQRFYLTLMLWDLWKQHSVWEVAEVFGQTRGFLQNLLSQAAAFASCVLHFCQELEELWAYQHLLGDFVKRVSHCVSSELLPLMEVPGVKMARAKQLCESGYRSIAHLANADEADLVRCVEYLSKSAARQMVSAAKNILEEKTAALMEEVDLLTTVEVINVKSNNS